MPAYALPVEPATIAVSASVQQVFDTAVLDRRGGRFGAALSGFQAVLEADPANLDARLNLGLTLLALNRLDEAEQAFETVLEAAPDYVDARLGLFQVASRRGDAAAARRHLAQAKAAAPDRDDIQALSSAIDDPLFRIDVDVSRSRLSQDLPDWTSQRLAGSRRLDERTAAGLSIERTERFGNQDVYLEAQIDRRWGAGSAYMAVGGAPGGDYRARQTLRIGGAMPLASGVGATLDAGVARYATGTVHNIQPGLTASLASDRLVLAARWIQVWDEQDRRRSGYSARATMAVTGRTRVTLSYADAPEGSEGVTVDVRATGIGLDVDLFQSVTARLAVVQEDRNSYDREEIAFGIGVRF